MKTKELIRQLMENDPSGEEECCVGNCDIHYVENLPGYYDGVSQVLIRDETNPYYNIIGARYNRSGRKVQIQLHSISDAICGNTSIPIDYSELWEDKQATTKQAHDNLRKWHDDMENEIELGHFQEWYKKKLELLTVDLEDYKYMAESFFKKNLSKNDPIVVGLGKSYNDARNDQWDAAIEVSISTGFPEIKVKK